MGSGRSCWSSCDRLALSAAYLIIGVLQLSAGLVLLKAKYVSLLSGPNFWTSVANLSVAGLIAASVSVWREIRNPSKKQTTRRHLLCALVSSVVILNAVTAGILYVGEKHTLVSIKLEDDVRRTHRKFVVQLIRYAYRASVWLPLVCIALSICFLIRMFYKKSDESPSPKQSSSVKPEGYNWVFDVQVHPDQGREARISSSTNESWKDLNIKQGKEGSRVHSVVNSISGLMNRSKSASPVQQGPEDVQVSLQALIQVLLKSNGTLKITDIDVLRSLSQETPQSGGHREDVFEDFRRDLGGQSHKVRRTSTTRDLTSLADTDYEDGLCGGNGARKKKTSQDSLPHVRVRTQTSSVPRNVSLHETSTSSDHKPSSIQTDLASFRPKMTPIRVPTPIVPPVDYTENGARTDAGTVYFSSFNNVVSEQPPYTRDDSLNASVLKSSLSHRTSGYASEGDSWIDQRTVVRI